MASHPVTSRRIPFPFHSVCGCSAPLFVDVAGPQYIALPYLPFHSVPFRLRLQRSMFMDGTLRKLRERALREPGGVGATYRLWRQMAVGNGTASRWIYNVYIVEVTAEF